MRKFANASLLTFSKSLTAVNITTWRLLDGDSLRTPFTYAPGNHDDWLPTSAYASDIHHPALSRLVAPAGADGIVIPRGAQITFRAPANSSWISLNVTRGPSFGILDIRLSPSIPGPARLDLSGDRYQAERVWFATLDPSIEYSARVFASGGPVALHSITFYDSGFRLLVPEPKVEENSGPNVGAIVGGVLGGSVALAALCAVVGLLGRQAQRRRVQREIEEDRGPHWLVDGPLVTPYPMPLPEAQPHAPAGALQTAKDRFIVAALTVWSNLRDTATRRDSAPVPVPVPVQEQATVDMEEHQGVSKPEPTVKRPSWPRPWRIADEPEQIPLMEMPQPNPVAPTPIDEGWQDVPWRRDSK